MPELHRKMILTLTGYPKGSYMPGQQLARKVGCSITTLKYHHKKLQHRIKSNKGPYGGYQLIR